MLGPGIPAEFKEKNLKGVDTSNRKELSDDEVAKKFFKNNPVANEPTIVYMPIYYESMERAMARIRTRVTMNNGKLERLEVEGKGMYTILDELVIEDWMKKFKEKNPPCKEETCFVDFNIFENPEVKIDFKESTLELRVRVPPDLRSPRSSTISKYSGFDDEITDEPAWFSSFINSNTSQLFRSDGSPYADGRDPLVSQFDSGTRFGGLVIDAKGRYTEKRKMEPKNTPAFIREDVRAVMDFPSSTLRAQVGDLAYPVKGFQTFRQMAGAALFTRFSLAPSSLTLPGGEYEIFLARPSRVTAFINDQMIQVLNLPAGRHNLRDFPFNSGLNDLRLEIVDDTGRVEEKRYTFFSNSELLKPGIHDVNYAYGVASEEILGERKYDPKNKTASFYHRFGLTQSLTVGANAQKDLTTSVAGLEALFSTPIGYFSLEPAMSTNVGREKGYAGRLRYILQEYVGKQRRNRFLALETIYLSETFAGLNSKILKNPTSLKVQLTHARTVSDKLSFNASLGYQVNRKLTPDIRNTYNFSVGASQRWNDTLSTNFSLRHTQDTGGNGEISIMAFLVWSMTKERQYFSASTDTGTQNSRADWTYQPTTGVGGVTAQANTYKKKDSTGYGGNIDYIANRARLNVAEDVFVENVDTDGSGIKKKRTFNTTNIRLGTALVFAKGQFAISRPITDAFAILKPLDNLKGQNVEINPQTDGTYSAQTDFLGSAAVSDLISYNPTAVVVNSKKLNPGTSLPRDHFTLKPPYHSGYMIEIGSDAKIYLKLQLMKDEKTPADMIAARAVYLDDPSKDAVMVFTNRSGLIRSEGFRPGKYRLEITEGGKYEPVEFEIPDNDKLEFDLGVIQLKVGTQ